MNRLLIFSIAMLMSLTGCMHTRLTHHARHHVQTVVDIQQQQVLDNIARFACNDKSTPFFSVPGNGTTSVGDNNTGAAGLTWNPTTLTGETFNFNKAYTNSENWTLTPVNAPGRLQAMRAAYQYTTGAAFSSVDGNVFAKWFPDDKCALIDRVPASGWYHVAAKGKVPKEACGVGRYGNCYIWVDNCGLESLHRLTMTILDLATLEVPKPKEPKTQEVEREWIPHFADKDHKIVDRYILKSVKSTANEKNGDKPARAPVPPLPTDTEKIRDAELNKKQIEKLFRELGEMDGKLNSLKFEMQPLSILDSNKLSNSQRTKLEDLRAVLKTAIEERGKKQAKLDAILNRLFEAEESQKQVEVETSPLPQYRDFSNPFSSQIFSGQR